MKGFTRRRGKVNTSAATFTPTRSRGSSRSSSAACAVFYQHCNDCHLHRYLAEFDFRYSNRVALGVDDVMRTMRAIKGAEGKRLTYNQSRRTRAA